MNKSKKSFLSLRPSRRFLVLDQTNQIVENFWSNRSSAVLIFFLASIRAEFFRYLLFISGLPSWAYKYLLINLRSSSNQKYVSMWENRISLFIELLYKKNCIIPPLTKGGGIIVFEEYLNMIIAYYHNKIIIFHNYKVHFLLK